MSEAVATLTPVRVVACPIPPDVDRVDLDLELIASRSNLNTGVELYVTGRQPMQVAFPEGALATTVKINVEGVPRAAFHGHAEVWLTRCAGTGLAVASHVRLWVTLR